MKKIKVIVWDIALLIGVMLFLSTKDWNHYNLIIGFETVLIFICALKFHIDYFKTTGKIFQ